MDNDFGTNDIITGRGLGIGGFGYGTGMTYGNSVLAADAHANGTGVAKMVECNAISNAASLDRISAQNEETRRILQGDELKKIVTDGQLQDAILGGQDKVALCDRFNALSKENAACCCETQKLVISENSKTRELINAQALKTAEREIDVLRGQANTQEIINALCCGCPSGRTKTAL